MTLLDERPMTRPEITAARRQAAKRGGAHVRVERPRDVSPHPASGEDQGARSVRVRRQPKKNVLRRIWGAFGTLLTVVAILLAVGAVTLAVSSHENAPGEYDTFGHPVMSVLSGSMTPAIRTGDLVIDHSVSKTQAKHLRVGQIISFKVGTKVFTHRIHAVKRLNGTVAYQTKGDANNAPDQPLVSPAQVIGVFDFKVPDGGYVLNALYKPTVFFLLIASPVLWLLSTWLFGKAREAERALKDPTSNGAAR